MARQTNYQPRPEIARLKSFNGADGFECFHLKWDIGKLPVNPGDGPDPDGYISTEWFKTNDQSEAEYMSSWMRIRAQEWQLRFFNITDECNIACINLLRRYRSGYDEEIPVIIRVKLVNKTKGIDEFTPSASFLLSGSDWDYDWIIKDEHFEKLSRTDGYMIHCWMDIPKKFFGQYNDGQNSGLTLLASSIARSFDKITIKNGDPMSDIELLIKDGSEDPPRFYCHRHILAARSPVFETMFTNGRFKESNERIVEIEDMDGSTLKLLLQYLYTGGIGETSKELLLSLLNAAEKYMLPELKDECALALIGSGSKHCDDGEWIEYLQVAETFDLKCLRKVCMLALSTNIRSVRDQSTREKVSSSALAELLDLTTKRVDITKPMELKTTPGGL